MTSPTLVGLDPAGARQLAATTSRWGSAVDDIVSLLNVAEQLSDVPSNAAIPLYQIASDGRAIAQAVTAAVAEIESYTLSIDSTFRGLSLPATRSGLGFEPGLGPGVPVGAQTGGGSDVDLSAAIAAAEREWAVPVGPMRPVDVTNAELGDVRDMWAEADRIDAAAAAIPDYMDYARESVSDEANQLREQAWDLAAEHGNPETLVGAIVFGNASTREIARALELQRAQQLFQTADGLSGAGFGFERDQIRAEANDILDSLFLTTTSRAVVAQFGNQLDPFETAALVEYASQAADDGAAVLTSADPVRVLQIMGQGYTEAAAVDLANSAGAGLESRTMAELEHELTRLDANHGTNTYEYDATLRELNERTQAISGEIYVRADLEAVRIADRSGVSYGDAFAAVVAGRIDAVDGSPLDRDRQMAAIEADLQLLVEIRNQETHAAAIAAIGGTPSDRQTQLLTIEEARLALPDPGAEASRLRAIIGTGAPLFLAEALSGALPADASDYEAATIMRQINGLVSDEVNLSEATGVAIAAFELDIDVDQVIALAADEGIDLPSAFNLSYEAHRRDMTIDEYHAYNGFRDPETFSIIDNAQGGDRDGKVSIADINYVIANRDDPRFSPEVVAAAIAFRDSGDVMARLDTARDFGDNVVDHESFGRDRVDDLLWSQADLDSFELKQSLNFILADHVDLIDTAGEGGRTDAHLSKQDFEAVLDDAEGLGLSAIEISALTTVINGKLYDQNWLERNRDSLAIAAAVVAGTVIFVATGGVGAGLSVGLVTSVAAATGAGALAAGTTTLGINSFTQEDLSDGVIGNTVQGGFVGGLAAPGLATGGAGWGTASIAGRAVIGAGLTGEAAGLVGVGALDWAIDPFYGGDSIDLDNLKGDADRASLLLAGGSLTATLAGGRYLVDDAAEAAARQLSTDPAVVDNLAATIAAGGPGAAQAAQDLAVQLQNAAVTKIEIDELAGVIAETFDGAVATAPVKGPERALQKVLGDYGGDASQIGDLARNTIVVPAEHIDEVVAALEETGASVKVVSAADNQMGYSGVNAKLTTDTGLGEIQVNTPEMIFAKESADNARAILGDDVYNEISIRIGVPGGRGHDLYGAWRELDPSSEAAQRLAQESIEYYAEFR